MKITKELLEKISRLCESHKSSNSAFLSKLKRTKPKNLDKVVLQYHMDAFLEIDCLECANCCKSISPTLYEADIERLAQRLKLKIPAFKDTYLKIDEDGDYVFTQTPCPFLGTDNYCFVYSDRPKACREYPHTDRKRFYQIVNITGENMSICPAVFEIVEKLKKDF